MMIHRTALAIVLVISALASGCDSFGGGAAEAPATRQIPVDAKTRYAYQHPHKGFQLASSLDAIPMAQRAAVVVYRVGETQPGSERTVYVADLMGEELGEAITTRRMSRREHLQRALAADRAAWLAERVELTAQEFTQLHPNSERSKASRKARQLLDETVSRETQKEAGP